MSKNNMSCDDAGVEADSPNAVCDNLVRAEFGQHFQNLKVATQHSAPLCEPVYVGSRVICLTVHSETEFKQCICSEQNRLTQLIYRDKVLPISKKRKLSQPTEHGDVCEQKSQIVDDSGTCSPFEQHLYVPTIRLTMPSANQHYCVYLLRSISNKRAGIYCGMTNNRARRIRQHNGEIQGGAKRTRAHRPWSMVAFVNGFDRRDAARFEWSMHHPQVRRLRKPHHGMAGKMNCMLQLLTESAAWQDRFTDSPIDIVVESDIVLSGTHLEFETFLRNVNPNKCEIHYRDNQLRLYRVCQSETDCCLARKSLCQLEAKYCCNHLRHRDTD